MGEGITDLAIIKYGDFMVYINKTEDGGYWHGLLMNPYIGKIEKFQSADDMISKINKALQCINTPDEHVILNDEEVFRAARDFSCQLYRGVPKRGRYFCMVQILYTEYGGWQGRVWGPTIHKTTFLSTQDLISKMDNSMKLHK